MSIQTHLQSLSEKRAQLKRQIAEETHHPAPNLVLITQLKKQNLSLKEEMQRYLILLKGESSSASS